MFTRIGGFDSDLFNEFRRMQQELDQALGTVGWPSGIRSVDSGSFPPINVAATPEQIDVYVFAAGLDPDSLDISIQQNLLSLVGRRELIREEGADYYRKERFEGDFRRVVTLPDDVDPDRVEAAYKDGVLRVTVMRHESAKPKQIEIH